MSEFDMLVQVAMWFTSWVIWMVSMLVMLVVHVEVDVNQWFMSMKMGMPFGHEQQNSGCHGT